MDVVSVLALGSVKEEGDDPAADATKGNISASTVEEGFQTLQQRSQKKYTFYIPAVKMTLENVRLETHEQTCLLGSPLENHVFLSSARRGREISATLSKSNRYRQMRKCVSLKFE